MPTGNVCFGGELDGWRQPGLQTCQRNAILGKQQVTQSLAICPGATGCLQIFFFFPSVCMLRFFSRFFFSSQANRAPAVLGSGSWRTVFLKSTFLQEHPRGLLGHAAVTSGRRSCFSMDEAESCLHAQGRRCNVPSRLCRESGQPQGRDGARDSSAHASENTLQQTKIFFPPVTSIKH